MQRGGNNLQARPSERLSRVELDCLKNLLKHRKEFIIMIDRNAGTGYENEKELCAAAVTFVFAGQMDRRLEIIS